MLTKLKDKIRFHSYVRQSRGAEPDQHPDCEFHALEISNKHAKRQFITFYTKANMSAGAFEKLKDILPLPYYHDDKIFHADGNPARWVGVPTHYHVLYQMPPNRRVVEALIERLEALGRDVYPDIKLEINTYYNGETN